MGNYLMAKKAKRRGRPPRPSSPDKMDVSQLRQYIAGLEKVLAKKVRTQTAYFQTKLSELNGYASKKVSAVVRAVSGNGRKTGTRRKAAPKYRSQKDSSVTWSGRGVTPVWMREEMKGTKLKKDDFLIAKAK